MKTLSITMLVSVLLFLSDVASAAAPLPTCELADLAGFTQTVLATDGYGPINELPGSELEVIGDRVDYAHQGFLHARSFDISGYTRQQLETSMSTTNYADMIYAYRGEEALMSAGIEEMPLGSLLDETFVKQQVFSEFVEFNDAEYNSLIPVATYKFWGYLVPPEGIDAIYNLRISFDDGMVLHMDYGSGLEVIAENFGFNYNETQIATHGGDSEFHLVGGTPYAFHLQWFNKDGPQILKLEYSLSGADEWQQIPQS